MHDAEKYKPKLNGKRLELGAIGQALCTPRFKGARKTRKRR